MTIKTRHPSEFAPVVRLVPSNVVTGIESSAETSDRGLTYNVITPSAIERRCIVEGFNLENVTVTSESPNQINAADFPLLVRAEGFSGSTQVFIDNGKAKASAGRYTFSNTPESSIIDYSSIEATPDSYAEYTRDIIIAIADAVADNQVFSATAPHYRVNLDTFPHAQLTGIAWSTRGPLSGRRVTAITPRHVIHCAHYGTGLIPGTVVKFLTAANVIVERTVIARFNLYDLGHTYFDTEIALLNADLPESIVPLKIPGEWFTGVTLSTATELRYSALYAFGLTVWGNDGTWSPGCPGVQINAAYVAYSESANELGLNASAGPFFSPFFGVWSDWDRSDLANLSGQKFHHVIRGGDSGCPIVRPCDGGWMLTGSAQGDFPLSEPAMNSIIAHVDSLASPPANTGYTVTVATDPTL